MPRGAIQPTITRSRRDSTVPRVAIQAAPDAGPGRAARRARAWPGRSCRSSCEVDPGGQHDEQRADEQRADVAAELVQRVELDEPLVRQRDAQGRRRPEPGLLVERLGAGERGERERDAEHHVHRRRDRGEPDEDDVERGGRRGRSRIPVSPVWKRPGGCSCRAMLVMPSATVAPIGSMKMPSNAEDGLERLLGPDHGEQRADDGRAGHDEDRADHGRAGGREVEDQ